MAIDHPAVIQTERTGYAKFKVWGPKEPSTYINTACDACGEWETVIQFRQSKLCDSCASEEGIKVL